MGSVMILSFLYLCILYIVLSKIQKSSFTPFKAFLGVLAPMYCLGPFIVNFINDMSSGGGVSYAPEGDTLDYVIMSHHIMIILSALVLGYFIYAHYIIDDQQENDDITGYKLNETINSPTFINIFLLLTIIFVIVGNGINGILYRDSYMYENIRELKIIGNIFTPASILLIGYKYDKMENIEIQFIYIIFITLITFSLASRALALIPVAYALGIWLSRPNPKRLLLVIGSIFLFFEISQIPLLFRGLPEHGLIPYTRAIFQESIFSTIDWYSSLYITINNILISVPIAFDTFSAPPIPKEYFWLSIDPRFGEMTNWYQINSELSINSSTPFSSVGELLNYGYYYSLPFMFCLGLIFGHIDKKYNFYFKTDNKLMVAVTLFLTIYAAISFLQYNLRSSIRLFYYIEFIILFYFFISRYLRHT